MDEREFLKKKYNATDEEVDLALSDADQSVAQIRDEVNKIVAAVYVIKEAVESAKDKIPSIYVKGLIRSVLKFVVGTVTGCDNVEIETGE